MHGEIWRRSVPLMGILIGMVIDSEDGVPLPELVKVGSSLVDQRTERPRWSPKTVENTVRDLASFGVFRVTQRKKDRVFSITILGRAWIEREILPGLGDLRSLEVAVEVLFAGEDPDEDEEIEP